MNDKDDPLDFLSGLSNEVIEPTPDVKDHAKKTEEWFKQWSANLQPEDFTCHGCPHAENCDYVWDYYNTDGDCLAEK